MTDPATDRRRVVADITERAGAAMAVLASGDARGTDTLDRLAAECADRLGPDDRQTLRVRVAAASWRGELGQPHAARAELAELYAAARAALGDTDADTLLVAANVGAFTGISGDTPGAVALLQDLLPAVERRFGAGSSTADTVRTNLSVWAARCADTDPHHGRRDAVDAPAS